MVNSRGLGMNQQDRYHLTWPVLEIPNGPGLQELASETSLTIYCFIRKAWRLGLSRSQRVSVQKRTWLSTQTSGSAHEGGTRGPRRGHSPWITQRASAKPGNRSQTCKMPAAEPSSLSVHTPAVTRSDGFNSEQWLGLVKFLTSPWNERQLKTCSIPKCLIISAKATSTMILFH